MHSVSKVKRGKTSPSCPSHVTDWRASRSPNSRPGLSIVRRACRSATCDPLSPDVGRQAAWPHYRPAIHQPAPLGTAQMCSWWKASTSSIGRTESQRFCIRGRDWITSPRFHWKLRTETRSWTHTSWITALCLNHKTLLPLVHFAPSRVIKKRTAMPK